MHLRVRVGQAEDHGLVSHQRDDLLRHGAAGDPDVEGGAVHDVGQLAGAAEVVGGVLGQRELDGGEVGALGVQHPLSVEDREVAHTGLEQDPGHSDAGRPCPRDDHPDPGRVAAGELEGVLESRERNAAVPCWSSCKTGWESAFRELVLDRVVSGAPNVLEVDPGEPRREPQLRCRRARLDSLVSMRIGVALIPAKLLVEDGLALHHRHGSEGADVSQSQYTRAVRKDGRRRSHPKLLPGEVERSAPVPAGPKRHASHARRVGHRQLVAPGQRHRGAGLHLAADVQVEDGVTGVRMGVVWGSHHQVLALRAAGPSGDNWGTWESVTAAAGAAATPGAGRRRSHPARGRVPGGASRLRRRGCR